MDDWPHWQHGADNNPASADTVAKDPYLTQFLALPYYTTMPSFSVLAGGRQFRVAGHMAIHEREEQHLNTLFATSAYNGTLLWTRSLPEGYLVHRSMMVATPEVLYLLEPDRCVVLDGGTGGELRSIESPAPGAIWKWIALDDGVLYALLGDAEMDAEIVKRERPWGAWGWDELSLGYYEDPYPWGFGGTLAALDPETGEVLWTREERDPIDSRALCMNATLLFAHSEGRFIAALDRATGAEVWRNDDRALLEAVAESNDWGLGFKTSPYSLCTEDNLFFSGRGRANVVGVDARTGAFLWSKPGAYNATNLLFFQGALYAHIPSCTVIAPLTGDTLEDLGISKRSCARLTACPDSLFHRGSVQGGEGTTRFDVETREPTVIHAFRPPCNDGIIPAFGLLHISQWDCDCNLQLMGGIAVAPAGDFVYNRKADETERLEFTSERASDAPLDVRPGDWPTYRGDNPRSASTPTPVRDEAAVLWRCKGGAEPITPPVCAGGLAFVGDGNGVVRALDLATGRPQWTFATAGPVRAAPAVWEGRVYVGSADGYAYCLDANSGTLLWRFRAAPVERRIMVFGRLSSTWPVNSGVLVEDGIAYVAAGIINYDGTHVYALDARTGRIRWQNNTSGHLNPSMRTGVSAQGDLALAGPNLMLAGGNTIGAALYDRATGRCLNPPPPPDWPTAIHGSEVCWMLDKWIVQGGARLFNDPEDPICNWRRGYAFSGDGVVEGKMLPGGIAPAFGRDTVVIGGEGPLQCASYAAVEAWTRNPNHKQPVAVRWTAQDATVTSCLAIAPNAVVAAGKVFLGGSWGIAAYDLRDGRPLWRAPTGARPRPGGLAVTRDGAVLLALANGEVLCAG